MSIAEATPLSEKFTLHLVGRITLPVPLAVIRPGESRTPTTKLIMGSVAYEVPVINGETLKGRLRRIGVDLLVEAITANPDFHQRYPGRNAPFDLDDYYYQALGGVKGAGEENPRDILRNDQLRRQNPLVSLFGAATPWITGRLSVESAIPDEPMRDAVTNAPVIDTVSAGVRRDDLKVRPEITGLFTVDQLERWVTSSGTTRDHSRAKRASDDIERRLRTARRNGSDDVTGLEAELAAAKRVIHDIEDREEFKQAINRPLPGYSAIPKGFSAPHRFSLENSTVLEIGLFLAILERFATNPRLGGHATGGCGRLDADYTLLIRRPRSNRMEPAGNLTIDSNQYALAWKPGTGDSGADIIQAAKQAWIQAAANILAPERFDFHRPKAI